MAQNKLRYQLLAQSVIYISIVSPVIVSIKLSFNNNENIVC